MKRQQWSVLTIAGWDSKVKVAVDWSGPGYGEADASTEEAIRLAARLEGLALDPAYSGKGTAGLVGLARQGRFQTGGPVVWIHTRGSPGIFAYPTTMGRLAGDGTIHTRKFIYGA